MHYDLIITGGTVIDGSRAPRFDADVAIHDGKIAAIGPHGSLQAQESSAQIDARGLVVAPGFIDTHTHDDQALLLHPGLPFKVSQGVTSVVVGNCGISQAPWRAGAPRPSPLDLVEQHDGRVFERFADYLQALREQPAAVNVAALVGHTTLRALSMDDLNRPASAAETDWMAQQVANALDAGAIGMSTGTFYPPAAAASTDEIIAVGQALRDGAGVFATHMRDEADQVLEAIDETLAIGRALNCQVVISHHKTAGTANFGRSLQTLARISQARQHQCVGLDCYPYTAGSTMIRTDRAMLVDRILINTSEPHPECNGRDLADIAADWGVSREEAAQRLSPGSAVYFMMDEQDVQRILTFDATMIGSDGIPLGPKPHPRLWGTFPRVLGHYSRDLGLFPLETAVWKMTGLSAQTFGLHDRGTISVGKAADLVIFNPQTVSDTATYDNPVQVAAGIEQVLVNGQLTWQRGEDQGARAGQVLRRQASPPAASR